MQRSRSRAGRLRRKPRRAASGTTPRKRPPAKRTGRARRTSSKPPLAAEKRQCGGGARVRRRRDGASRPRQFRGGPGQETGQSGRGPDQRAVPEQSRLRRRAPARGLTIYPERSAGDPVQAQRRLEPHHAHHRTGHGCRAYHPRQPGRHRRHRPELLLVSGEAGERDHPGGRTGLPLSDGDAGRNQRQPIGDSARICGADAVERLYLRILANHLWGIGPPGTNGLGGSWI